ncbi:PQ-loop repeat-containing protein [Candidatus Dependentiae bacterium]
MLSASDIIIWGSEICFFIALLPQIILNYKIKTAGGLSDIYLICYFSAYVINLFYIYGLNFPMAYKVVAPFSLLAVFVMILQKSFYNNIFQNYKIAKWYYIDFLLLISFIPFVFLFPVVIGHFAGWIIFFIWCFYQFPQVFKIYTNKSVAGFSFILVSLIGFGNLIEFGVAIIFKLPVQTLFITVRGMIIYLIYCLEFWKYRKTITIIEVDKK